MRLSVKVIPNSKRDEVLKEDNKLKVRVKSPPIEGKANKAAINLLSKYFKAKKTSIKIIKGEKSREKIVEINY